MVTIPPGAVVVLLEVAVVRGSVDEVLGEADEPVVDELALVLEVPVEVPELVEVGLVVDVLGGVVVVEEEEEVGELEVVVVAGFGGGSPGISARFLYKRNVIGYNGCGSRISYCSERAGIASDEASEQNQKQVRGENLRMDMVKNVKLGSKIDGGLQQLSEQSRIKRL